MPTDTGPDRYCRVCHTLLLHLESGTCIVHMRDDARCSPDDAVMLATEELREALKAKDVAGEKK